VDMRRELYPCGYVEHSTMLNNTVAKCLTYPC
jgi:hypothetical protein